ncbi:unnamed protein product [Paramecium pentaurelia]|uniref:Uncharacterized protein n=1 Tax=Paramecium pentaurelia TaxID=43138 RepID=A0A8S1YB85_9CILI|nr:unnamed protein product [Paramecium pentaurelia]
MNSEKDFQYDIHDVQNIKTAFLDLQQEESTGFKLGFGTAILSYFVFRRFTYLRTGPRFVGSMILGSQVYGFYTHRSRAYYDYVAQQVNLHASEAINQCLGH